MPFILGKSPTKIFFYLQEAVKMLITKGRISLKELQQSLSLLSWNYKYLCPDPYLTFNLFMYCHQCHFVSKVCLWCMGGISFQSWKWPFFAECFESRVTACLSLHMLGGSLVHVGEYLQMDTFPVFWKVMSQLMYSNLCSSALLLILKCVKMAFVQTAPNELIWKGVNTACSPALLVDSKVYWSDVFKQ